MKIWTRSGGALCCLVAGAAASAAFTYHDADAYEVSTHQTLARRSMEAADAFKPDHGVLNDLALDARTLLPDDGGALRSIEGLLAHGARWEDDRDEFNVVFHFLDPQHGGRGLNIAGLSASSSLQWTVQDNGFVPARTIDNPHSYADAQRYFLDGLTHQTPELRERYLGLMFQSLGHVVHHLQDMAQPSHVRNDPHLAKFGVPPDLHHAWTAAQETSIPTAGYPKPEITELAHLWSNAGAGMADFASRNFVSPDSNFTASPSGFRADPEYASPVPDNARIEKVTLQSLLDSDVPLFGQAQVWFIGNQVTDVLQPERSGFNQRASSFSIFNEDLNNLSVLSPVTFNRFNAAAANEWLLPRAVAYGAALFDYFFRARMQIVASTFTDTAATVTVRNASKAGIVWKGQAPEQGDGFEWALFYDNADGVRSRLALNNDDLGSRTLSPGETYELSFSLPADFDRRNSKPFTLVFNGVVGSEAAISALAFGPTEATFLVTPNYLPADGIAGPRVIHRNRGGWELTPERNRVAGNVDWKGHNVGDVLSWMGPGSRYFGLGQPTTAVYRQGAVLTQAPGPVVGAAVSAAEPRRLLVVTRDGSTTLSIYTRPFAPSYTNDGLYDPVTNPAGWRKIHTSNNTQLMSPVFFNSSGTQAQAMVLGPNRLKLTLSGDSVTSELISTVGRAQQVQAGRRKNDMTTQGHDFCSGPYSGECSGNTGRYEAGYEASETANHTTTTVEEQPSVVCVDYRGDEEVLCTYSFEQLDDSALDKVWGRDGKYTYTCPDRKVTSGGVTGRGTLTQIFNRNFVRSLRAGNLEIPLQGWQRLATHMSQVSWFWPGVPAGTSVQYVWDDVMTEYNGRILFVDARADVALFASRKFTRSIVGQGSATELVGDLSGEIGAQWLAPEVAKVSEAHELVAMTPAGKVSTPVGEAVETESPHRIGQPFAATIDKPWISATCSTWPGQISESSYSRAPIAVEQDDSGFSWNQVYSGTDVSVAVSRDGQVVMNAPLLQVDSSGGVSILGKWNHLSGGRLPVTIPGAGTEPTYAPVGLLE